jgi:4-diphosphocytidyl-2-C-methyl-D-erythritol kinase
MSLQALYDLPAPAKLNLFLHITGRRPDGYHLLQSMFVLIDWADTLHLEVRTDGQLQRHDLSTALPPEDLCLRAARALQAESGCSLGADIHIQKQVPWGAGLGGGSSDAATVLLGLNRLWRLNWPRQRLLALGARLGADVPFFIGGHNAIVEGIGEILTPAPFAPHWFQLLKPPAAASTAEIFGHPLVKRDSEPVIVHGLLAAMQQAFEGQANAETNKCSQPLAAWSVRWGHNDLQAATEALCPDVKKAVVILQSVFGHARMSGSGSAVFASAGTDSQPLATCPEGFWPDDWVGRMCRSLPIHPLVNWAD